MNTISLIASKTKLILASNKRHQCQVDKEFLHGIQTLHIKTISRIMHAITQQEEQKESNNEDHDHLHASLSPLPLSPLLVVHMLPRLYRNSPKPHIRNLQDMLTI